MKKLIPFLLPLIVAACGTSTDQRAATGGLTGATIGALAGGPLGLLIGAAAGGAGGAVMPKGADEYAQQGISEIKR